MDETIDTGGDSSGYDYFFSGDNGTSGTGTDTSSVDPTAVDPSKTYYDQAEGVTYYKNAAGQIISTRTDTGAVSKVDPATGTITSSSGGIASGTDTSGILSGLKGALSQAGVSQSALDKIFGGAGLATLLGGIAGGAGALYGGSSGTNSGAYTGTIPKYTVARQQVANAYDPTRRPGSGGQYYLTDAQYTPAASTSAADVAAAQAISKQSAANQAAQLAEINRTNPFKQTELPAAQAVKAAQGGIMPLAKGRYLAGGTDGMADKINTTIDGDQPAKLSHGEFVVPADVVSHLGNGNSDAGAQRLYDMMDKIRKARTGTTKQGKQIKPDKYLPS